MNKIPVNITNALNYIILGVTVISALSGATNLAIAGIAIYLTSQLIKENNVR